MAWLITRCCKWNILQRHEKCQFYAFGNGLTGPDEKFIANQTTSVYFFIVYAKGLLGTSQFIGLCFYLLKFEVEQTKWKENKVLLVFICSIGNLIVESNGKVMEACISYCPAASMWRGTGKHSLLLSV